MGRFLLVPHDVTNSSLTLWVAAVDDAPLLDVQLMPKLAGEKPPSNAGQWPTGSPQPRLRYHEIAVEGLSPRQTYNFSLLQGGAAVAEARVTTLPAEIPPAGDGPFIVLLGSCFCRLEDPAGSVGKTFLDMPHPDRPDIKIFCGDQVYLDSPYKFFLARPHSVDLLAEKFFEHYTETWAKAEGLSILLGDGANYFCSDDHEYWNNAPNAAPHLQDTWPVVGHRQEWWDVARELYLRVPEHPADPAIRRAAGLVSDCRYADEPLARRKRLHAGE